MLYEDITRFLLLLLALLLTVLTAACVAQPLSDCAPNCPENAPAVVEAAPAPAPAPAPEPVKPVSTDPYDMQPKKLTTADCGSCHGSYFLSLQKEGGKHRFDCANCHTVYHAYNGLNVVNISTKVQSNNSRIMRNNFV